MQITAFNSDSDSKTGDGSLASILPSQTTPHGYDACHWELSRILSEDETLAKYFGQGPLGGTILSFLFLFLFLNRRFPGFQAQHPSLFPRQARLRLNSFGTLDLKIVGKKVARYRCVPKMASPEAKNPK